MAKDKKPFRSAGGGSDRPRRPFDRPRDDRPRFDRPRGPRDDRGPRPARYDDKPFPGERVAKIIARSGLGSRREVEDWIDEGRVAVNGDVIESPALNVTRRDRITVDGEPLPPPERTRLWLYHKPRGLVTTESDPDGRPTVFEMLPRHLPRVLSIGRLDVNTEGLLLLTNDGGVKRALELPATGWLRRYRVRAFGEIDEARLAALDQGLTVDGVEYGPVEARVERRQGDNLWLTMGIREGKNREIKVICEHLGLKVNRLIRISFGPFQLNELDIEAVEEVPLRVLREQLGERLIEEAGATFDGPVREGDPRPFKRREEEPRGEDAGVRKRTRPVPDEERDAGRATRKAKAFAEAQEVVRDPTTSYPSDPTPIDAPDVTVDPETGRIALKPKTIEDRKGRSVEVAKKPREDDDRPRRFRDGEERPRRPRVFDDTGDERRAPREHEDRPRSFGFKSRGGPDGKPRSFGSRDQADRGPKRHAFRDDGAPRRSDEDRPRARRFDEDRPPRRFDDDRPPRRFDRDDRPPRRFDRDDRPPRRFDRDERAPDRGEGRPFRPRRDDDRPGGGFRRDRDDRPAGGGFRGRSDRPQGGFQGRRFDRDEDRPRAPRRDDGDRPFRPRPPRSDDRGPPRDGGDRPFRPRTPRSDDRGPPRDGGDRPFRPRKPGPGRPRSRDDE